ncbi:unnamed protein product [Nezara viridula]|uniref:Neuropeptide n=1 Tax=Nezara viridula TaxID=85310 RepID=A0A9P0HIC2_NEZVI|nr:unnamed protein product [Nezara viridula]
MIAFSCIFLLSFITFQGECCRINKMVMNPFNQDDCTDIQSTMNCLPSHMKHVPMGLHKRIPCPSLVHCDPYTTKITSTVLPPELECIEPIMTKCCCVHCPKPYPCQGLPIQMLPNDCWC